MPNEQPVSVNLQSREAIPSRVSGLVLTVLIGTSLATVLVGTFTVRSQSELLDPLPEFEEVRVQKEALRTELASLNQNLDRLADNLIETRGVEEKARLLAGLGSPTWGEAPLGGDPVPDVSEIPDPGLAQALRTSRLQVEGTLREARQLKRSFHEILRSMEDQAEAWAHIPSVGPIEDCRVTSSYGLRRDPFTRRLAWHHGIDLGAPHGTAIRAPAEGRVTRSGYYRGYGYMVEIDHGNGLVTRYAHNARNAVKTGKRVQRGQILAFVGRTGRANAPHLHYEVRLHGKPVNPEPYLLAGTLQAD